MTRGRRPTPTATKRRAGNPGKRRLGAEPRNASSAAPKPPPPVGPGTFRERYAQTLSDAGVLTGQDAPAFDILGQAYWIASKAASQLEREPFTRDDENGVERKSPWLQIWRDAAATFRAYAAEFGMTPAARARVTPAPAQKKSLAERLFESVTHGTAEEEG